MVKSAALLVDGHHSASSWWLTLDGGVSAGPSEAEAHVIDFQGLVVDSTVCQGAPSGEIGLRDPTGFWYTVTLECSSCGVLSWQGEAVGEGCVPLEGPLETLRTVLEAG